MGLFSGISHALGQVANVAKDSAALFVGGTSGVALASGQAPTAKTIALDAAGLTAGQSLAGAALPGYAAVIGGAKYAVQAVDAGGHVLSGNELAGKTVALNFNGNEAGPGSLAPAADKTPASPPVLAPSPLVPWLVVGAALVFLVMKG